MIIGIDASRANVTRRTGTERYAWEVIRRMVHHLGDHQVRLYVREPLLADWPAMPPNIEVRVLRWPPAVVWTHLRLSWELLWHRPDMLFVPADTVPLVHPKKTITTIHDIAFERFPELYRSASVQRRLGWLRPLIHAGVRLVTLGRYSASERDYHRWSVRQAVRTCPSILTVSEFSKQEIVQVLKVSADRIKVIPLGVDQPEHFEAMSETRRQQAMDVLGLTKPFFLFIGRLEAKKNIGLMIRAYRRYVETTPDPIDLVLVGVPGFGWEETASERAAPVLKNRLHIFGWQSDEIVDAVRCRATAVLVISQYEGFGLPVLEAMSAGTLVISSRHGSLPEVAGTNAIFVETDDIESIVSALQRASTDQQLRVSLVASGRQHVRGFTWEQTAEKTLAEILR